jgi:hypothetical protein
MAKRLSGAVALVATSLAGLTAAAAPPRRPADPGPEPATITIYGRPGSFGALGDAVPSGQRLVKRSVPGWGFPAGRQGARTALAADGTVLIAGRDHGMSLLPPAAAPTAAELVVATYQPATNRYSDVRIATSTGRDRVLDRAGRPAAPSIADLEPIAGGTAVAFTVWPADADLDTARDGSWPMFGVLTTVDGRWQAAPTNQWTAEQLRGSGPAGPQACPERPEPPVRGECRGFTEMAAMARSRDIIVAQYAGLPSNQNGGLTALRITGPDAAGRFTVRVTGHYMYPRVRDPLTADPNDHLAIAPRAIEADPTSRLGDERFAVTLDVVNGNSRDSPTVVQEFSYDAGTGAIRPVSAPLIPGDRAPDGAVHGFGAVLYDSGGNLWAARTTGLHTGKLAVYAITGDSRRTESTQCRFDPLRSMESYVTTGSSGRRFWGQACRPDYDILQAQEQLGSLGMTEDPVSHDIVVLYLDGGLMVIRPSGSGTAMTFQIGNLVDLGRKLLPIAQTDFPNHWLAGVDGRHRLWLSGTQGRPDGVEVALDQWLYSVDLGDLFEPPPVVLPVVPGRSVTIQAERTATISTTQRTGVWATADVVSDAHTRPCLELLPSVDCAADGAPGNGFVLADASRYGKLAGAVEYRVSVARAGTYRVAYRVATFVVTSGARIELGAGDRTYDTPVSTGGGWRTVWHEEPVALAAGEQYLRLSVPSGAGGWYLNSLTLRRI